jgi:hypothetical protein
MGAVMRLPCGARVARDLEARVAKAGCAVVTSCSITGGGLLTSEEALSED